MANEKAFNATKHNCFYIEVRLTDCYTQIFLSRRTD